LAYLLVTVPMLISRIKGTWPGTVPEGRFSLGRWGLPVNIVGIIWGGGMVINLAWPRAVIYNADPPFHWYLKYFAVIFVAIAAGAGFAYYWFVQRHKAGVLAEHAAIASEPNDEEGESANV
jgi:hypothetical protein